MSSSRLPGVYFETVVPPVPEPLPRLDIAAFVGFAASGPLDVPVAVEDAARFQEIFGQDQALAWDPVAGATVYAQLPPAVRAFFRNGGQRCWVVRVADNNTAASNSFVIPGMLQSVPGLDYEAAVAAARSQGSWSDDFAVNATLSFEPLAAQAPTKTPEGISIVVQSSTATSIVPGDMLQIAFDSVTGSPPTASMPVLFLAVSKATNSTIVTAGGNQQVTTVVGQCRYWFQPAAASDFRDQLSSPPFVGADSSILWLGPPAAATWLTAPTDADISIGGWGISAGSEALELVFVALRSQAQSIPAGTWVRVKLNPSDLPPGAKELLVLVESVRGSTAPANVIFTSPAVSDEETVEIVATSAWWVLDEAAAWGFDLSVPRVDLVTLQLWVRDGAGQVTTLENLGLSRQNDFYLGYLPTDAQLYAQSDNPEPPPGSALWAEADHPRFPLAMNLQLDSSGRPVLPDFLPLGVPGLVNADFYQSAISSDETALCRDGLDLGASGGMLPASLFLDPDLADCGVRTLLTAAFHKQYQLQRPGSNTVGEPLVKLHAVLPLEEISLLALPDAMHAGWTQASAPSQQPLGSPTLKSLVPPDGDGSIALVWTSVDSAVSYTLQQSNDPLFGTFTTPWQGAGQQASPPSPGLVESDLFAQPSGCPSQVYFRVAANDGVNPGPWSNTLAQVLPFEAFQRCASNTLAAPTLDAPEASRGRVILSWSDAASNIDAFELQLAYEPLFALPENIFNGNDTQFEIWSDPTRTAYFRVSASSGATESPWSNTVVVVASDSGATGYLMNTSPEALDFVEQTLLSVHQAMLRLSAARADVFSVLGLPRQFDAARFVSYASQLENLLAPQETLQAPEDGDTTLSYGGIYFPWLIVRDAADDQPGAIRSVAPEGTVLGSIAAVTIAGGAWLAPGNQLLRGVVDLDPPTTDQAPLLFFENQLNLVVQEPRGFLAMSSFTLSSSPQLEDINVRRLLILLRRLALREGVDYVFQPNDSSFWRIVQRRFEDVLGGLFLKGAFAGSTQAESFRVTTDASVNPPESVEQGRFIVELRVAPSLPLEFLTVRLLQSGGDLTLSEET